LRTFKLKYYTRRFDQYTLHEKEMRFRNLAEAYRYIKEMNGIPIIVNNY
jgi:Asp-tRNA(Asn)/Glu-tRNA(Gln) amidotransferase B subunit